MIRSWSRRVFLLGLLALFASAPRGSELPAGNLPVLLLEVEADSTSVEPGTFALAARRSRVVQVDRRLLEALDPRRATRLRVDLFDGLSVALRFEEGTPTSSDGTVWQGRVDAVDGVEVGTALIAIEGAAVVGDISIPGHGLFHVRPLPSGLHVLREIDTEAELSCGADPLPAVPAPPAGPAPCPDDGSVIDILVVYTAQARASAGGTGAMLAKINQIVAYTNQAYLNSQIDTTWNVIETMEIPYVEDGDIFVEIGRVRIPDDGYMDEVPARRDAIGADVVSLIVNGSTSGIWCGVAATIGPGNPAFAYNVVRRTCPTATFAHEVGHNAGCAHEGCGSTYNRAHIVPGQFATIMKSVLSGLIQHHSNPDVLYQGTPTGVPPGQQCQAHNALTINENAFAMANLRCSFVDCNANGVLDMADITAGTSDDCNLDEIPDECQPDCNENGVQDRCDVDAGTSEDCNGDLVPDECQEDCNGNTLPDDCDIAAGTSDDCNQNGVPDECDLSSGAAPDCNGNLIPDDCDVFWIGSSPDCNQNWVPDECEPDCNGNDVADDCDISAGQSPDCNANEVPDECDLSSGTSVDTDSSGRPDECEDCDASGVVDSEEIATGVLQDGNGNSVPDDCENVHNVTRSKYHLTIQLGLDGAGTADTILVSPGVYPEALDFLGKPVALRSTDGPGSTVIDATGTGQSAVTLSMSGDGPDVSNPDGFFFGGILGFTISGGVGNLAPGGERHGGGVHVSGASFGNIQNCIVTGNTADRGAGVYVASEAPGTTVNVLANTVFRGNSAALEGGGLYVETGSFVDVFSSTFHQNSALQGGAIHGTAFVEGSVLWQNGAAPLAPPAAVSVQFSDVEGGAVGTGNLDVDPLFVDPGTGNLRLQAGSPCVDAMDQVAGFDYLDIDQDGDPFEPLPLDIELSPRSQDGNGDTLDRQDMGAYEKAAPASIPPPPIPDGTGPGQPLRVQGLDATGQGIILTWDPDLCPPERAKVLYGPLDELPILQPVDALCGAGTPTVIDPVFPGNLWVLVVADNPQGEEGSWGQSSDGERGGPDASGLCGSFVKVLTASCP